MARPKKDELIDYTVTHDLGHGLLSRATCPDGVPFVLLKDAQEKGLRLRITKAGGKYWQYERRINGKLFTRSLGEWDGVSIGKAQAEANRLRGLTANKTDPRDIEHQAAQAVIDAKAAADAAQTAG